ncbi:hypothetical protein M422DRAFT_276962 [Sphaerobolus stellatus SS14]|uniref:Uncharacterized protein n=1 Tax=Sphaerobolus stellatus (strain SS14) TaxID=990650 RepID=A0A0C9U0S6_SPHS4|nr:hypothetical protein M422DRAFT_276962 [Sphaerobolus stellatus SS14]
MANLAGTERSGGVRADLKKCKNANLTNKERIDNNRTLRPQHQHEHQHRHEHQHNTNTNASGHPTVGGCGSASAGWSGAPSHQWHPDSGLLSGRLPPKPVQPESRFS